MCSASARKDKLKADFDGYFFNQEDIFQEDNLELSNTYFKSSNPCTKLLTTVQHIHTIIVMIIIVHFNTYYKYYMKEYFQ